MGWETCQRRDLAVSDLLRIKILQPEYPDLNFELAPKNKSHPAEFFYSPERVSFRMRFYHRKPVISKFGITHVDLRGIYGLHTSVHTLVPRPVNNAGFQNI